VKLSKKLEGQAGGQPKIWRGYGPPRPLLRTATVALSISLLCGICYSTMEKLSWEFLIYCYIT